MHARIGAHALGLFAVALSCSSPPPPEQVPVRMDFADEATGEPIRFLEVRTVEGLELPPESVASWNGRFDATRLDSDAFIEAGDVQIHATNGDHDWRLSVSLPADEPIRLAIGPTFKLDLPGQPNAAVRRDPARYTVEAIDAFGTKTPIRTPIRGDSIRDPRADAWIRFGQALPDGYNQLRVTVDGQDEVLGAPIPRRIGIEPEPLALVPLRFGAVEIAIDEAASVPRRQPLTLQPAQGPPSRRHLVAERTGRAVFADVPAGDHVWELGVNGCRATGTVTVEPGESARVVVDEVQHFADVEVSVDVTGIPEGALDAVIAGGKPRGADMDFVDGSVDVDHSADGRESVVTVRDAAPCDWAVTAACRTDRFDVGVEPRAVLVRDGVAEGALRLFEMPPRRRIRVEMRASGAGAGAWISGASWLDPNPLFGWVRLDEPARSIELDVPTTGPTTLLLHVQQGNAARLEIEPSDPKVSFVITPEDDGWCVPLRTLNLAGEPLPGVAIHLDGELLGATDRRGFIEVPIAPTRSWETLEVARDDPSVVPVWAGRKRFTFEQLPLSALGVILTLEE